jgi:hypothetical protein
MDSSITPEAAAKAAADREKFNSVTKVELSSLTIKPPVKNKKKSKAALKSPDEKNPRWVVDPEEVAAARRAAKKAKREARSQDGQ